jgi:membrane-associated phospholipid phosphatase
MAVAEPTRPGPSSASPRPRPRLVDLTIVAYNLILIGYLGAHAGQLGWRVAYLAQHVAFIALAWQSGRLAASDRALARLVATFYPLLVVPLSFSELAVVMQRVDPRLFDAQLAAWDRAIFGTDPLLWFEGHRLHWLTEILLCCYLTFYFLPVWVALDVRRRDERLFALLTFEYVGCFLLSYLGYMLVPAIGPRFFLHGVEPLQGVLGFDVLLHGMNVLEGAARDCFPSGHVAVTVLVLVHTFRHARHLLVVLLPVGSGLLLATLYLRFHYVVDDVGGVLLAALVLAVFPPVFRAFPDRAPA